MKKNKQVPKFYCGACETFSSTVVEVQKAILFTPFDFESMSYNYDEKEEEGEEVIGWNCLCGEEYDDETSRRITDATY